MKHLRILEGEDWHLNYLIGRLREEDYNEVKAATGQDPNDVLRDAWLTKGKRWTIEYMDRIVGVFGLKDGGNEIGVPWLLGNEGIRKIGRAFVGESGRIIAGMLQDFPVLMNYVDARNKTSIRWLEWCGFNIHAPVPYGAEQLPFHPFIMYR